MAIRKSQWVERRQRDRRIMGWCALAVLTGLVILVAQRQPAGHGFVVERFGGPDCAGSATITDPNPQDPFIRFGTPIDGSIQLSGFLVVPQRGAWRLAVDVVGAAQLSIDGAHAMTVAGPREVARREHTMEMPERFRAVRLCFTPAAGGRAYLTWFAQPANVGPHLPPDPISPAWLLPPGGIPTPSDIDAALSLGRWRDFQRVLGLLFILLGLLGMGAVPLFRLLQSSGGGGRVALAAGAGAFLVRWIDLNGGTPGCDEGIYWGAARKYLGNVLRGDFAWFAFRWNHEHPPNIKWLHALWATWWDEPTAARAFSTSMGALTVIIATAFAHKLAGPSIAILSGLFLAFQPTLIAHSGIVGHETPMTLFFTAGMVAFHAHLRWCRSAPTWIPAVMLGLGVGTRFNTGAMAVAWLVLGVAWLLKHRSARARVRHHVPLLLAPVVAAVLLVVAWPAAWDNPWEQLRRTFQHWDHYEVKEFFLGEKRSIPELPHYYLVYFLACIPPVALLGLFAWPLLVPRRTRKFHHLLLWAWLAAPFLMSFLRVKQDGVRYIAPAMVPLCIIAAESLWKMFLAMRARVTATRLIRWAPIVAVVVTVWPWLRVRPYTLDYYGEQVGGPATVLEHRWFEVGWWGEGADELVNELNRRAPPRASVSMDLHCARFARQPRADISVVPPGRGDFHLYNNPMDHRPLPPGYHSVHQVNVAGAVIGELLEKDSATPPGQRAP